MKANELPIISFLQSPNIQFVIPVYQRNYDWSINECRELLNDIISVEKDKRGTHFIGSIVFIHEGTYSTSEVKELVIIDGQQRLTTINILLVALYRFANENDLKQDAERLFNMYLINQYVRQETSKLKLKQTDSNSKAFNAILYNNEDSYSEYSNVIENFNFFKSMINKNSFSIIEGGLNRLIFVEISLERDKDDPQRIFESLNSTGLDLSQSDLIRNFILMDLEPKEQNKVFQQIWNPIENNARDYSKQHSMVSDFIRDYITLKNKNIPNKNKVYLEFKKLYRDKKSEIYSSTMENIKALSFQYNKLINPLLLENSVLRRELAYIKQLEINVVYPFLLQVLEDERNGLIEFEELVKILKLIQSYAWRRFIVGLPTSVLNKIFMTLYSEVDHGDYYTSIAYALLKKKGSSRFPNDLEVKNSLKEKDLYNTKPKNRNYLFEKLENFNNREFVDTTNESITIEHIFPQNPNDDWRVDLVEDEYFKFKDTHINTIGNLTLSGNNGALGNLSFQDKLNLNNNNLQQGYKYSRLWLNSYLQKIESWNIENYHKRSDLIFERFINIWEFPKLQIEEGSFYSEQSIFNAEEPRFKKLEYFIFEDNKVEVVVVAQLFFYVINQLIDKNIQLLLDNSSVIKLSREKEDFRSPHKLIRGYFCEANNDSNSKFRVLKQLLIVFDIEEELLIKYSNDSVSTDKEPARYQFRYNFWKQFLPKLKNTSLFNKINPNRENWLSTNSGTPNISYAMAVSIAYVRVELSIISSNKERNKYIFKELYKSKKEIEKEFGDELIWEELPNNKMSRIKYEKEGVNLYEEKYWQDMNEFLIEYLPRFERAIKPYISRLK